MMTRFAGRLIIVPAALLTLFAVQGIRAGDGRALPHRRDAERFVREVWPLMADPAEPGKGCLACHQDDANNTSQLVLSGGPELVFESLLTDGYFDLNDRDSLLGRIASKRPEGRMPPVPLPRWSDREVDRLRRFAADIEAARRNDDREPLPQSASLERSPTDRGSAAKTGQKH